MSKKALATVAVVLFAAVTTCWAQQKEKPRPGITTIWGPARSVRVEQAEPVMKNGELVEGPRVLVQTITYSEDGTRHERTTFKPDGSVSYKAICSYDPDGRMLETAIFRDNGDPGIRYVNNYDGDKRLAGQIVYHGNGSIMTRIAFAYEGTVRTNETSNYDENGLVVSRSTGRVDLKQPANQMHVAIADRVEINESNVTDTPEGQVYITRENGQEVNRDLHRQLGKDDTEIVQYNPDGTVKGLERRQNELDTHGNFVKRTISVSSGDAKFKPVAVLYRTIEYYGEN